MEKNKTYETIVNKYLGIASDEQIRQLIYKTEDYINSLSDNNEDFIQDIYNILCPNLNKQEAILYVSEMLWSGEGKGEYWNFETIENLIDSKDIDVNAPDFYYVMNMMYSDYSSVLGDRLDDYIKMSLLFINDKDGKINKVKSYSMI